MKVDFRTEKINRIQLGDVLLAANGQAYLVAAEESEARIEFPVKLICLTTSFIENSFTSLDSLNKAKYITYSNPITKVAPADEIRITRIGDR